jgi:protease I
MERPRGRHQVRPLGRRATPRLLFSLSDSGGGSTPKVLFVIAPERFRDEELLEPKLALERHGAAVTVASTRPGAAVGMLGATVAVECTVRQAEAKSYEALVIVGGAGSPTHLWGSSELRSLVQEFHHAGKPVAAICLSGAVLARAGVLEGKRATVYPTERAILELRRGGATYVAEPVVEDGNLITASGPEAAVAFGAAVITHLGP